jgi:hypothetical protein
MLEQANPPGSCFVSTKWYAELAPGEKRTFWACFGGYVPDALDVQILTDPYLGGGRPALSEKTVPASPYAGFGSPVVP